MPAKIPTATSCYAPVVIPTAKNTRGCRKPTKKPEDSNEPISPFYPNVLSPHADMWHRAQGYLDGEE